MGKTSKNQNRILSKYIHEIAQTEPLSPDEEVELAQRAHQGDKAAVNKLVKSNLRFVVSVAKEYQGKGLPLIDLINEGNIGLMRAVHKFDETRGVKFISYAVWWIRQSILQALAEHSRIVRLPLNRVGSISKIIKQAEGLQNEKEREPRREEIAEQLELSTEDVSRTIRISKHHYSLDEPFRDDSSSSLKNLIGDKSVKSPDWGLMRESLRRDIEQSLQHLNQNERKVIQLYFGIGYEFPENLQEIGRRMGLTRERVRQIKENALRRLRHKARRRKLQKYLG